MTTAFTDDQLKDMQGFGIAGFRKDHQELMFVRFGDPAGGRRLLGWLETRTASAWEVGTFNQVFSEIRDRTGDETLCATWIGVLISAAGYAALDVATSGLPAGEGTNAFNAGMVNRSQQIGDTDQLDAPSGWLTAFRPGGGVHLCIVVAADERDDLYETATMIGNQVSACGCEVVFQESGNTLPGDLRGHEHFGFKDGISQPAIDGYDDPPQPNEPPAVAPGEFVLGYLNTGGSTAVQPGSLWFNGSFAAFRRLQQDVAAFRAQASAGVPNSNPVLTPAQMGVAMVGRWPSGAPLELNPTSDPGESGITNAFQYKAASPPDDDGHVCPHFAHIRKVNPRDETTPNPTADDPQLHRMIRRGIPFGLPLPDDATADDGQERGLHFLSIVSDLDQQFEFVQRQWVNNPSFPNGQPTPAGPYGPPVQGQPDGPDPIGAEGDAGEQCVLIQEGNQQHPFTITTQLVKVTAGEYFFAPSISAIGAIAGGATG